MEKICNKCKHTKHTTDFRYGRNKCVECQNADQRERTVKNRDEINTRKRIYYHSLTDAQKKKRNEFLSPEQISRKQQSLREYNKRDPRNMMLQNAKRRSKENGLDIDITKEDIVIPDVCPVFGTKLETGGEKDNRPSLDRIDNTKGYVKGNVMVISWRANRIKSDVSILELKKILEYMEHNV